MGELRDLKVQRVDAVDAPATGHKWVIIKASNEDVRNGKTSPRSNAAPAVRKRKGRAAADAGVSSAPQRLFAPKHADPVTPVEKKGRVSYGEALLGPDVNGR